MKKIIIIFIVLGLFLLITSEKNLKFCKKVFGVKSNSQKIQTDDYFKKLSINYYGTPIYAEELSLVNNSNSHSSDGDFIIPTFQAINKLKQERSFSIAHEMANRQQEIVDSGRDINLEDKDIENSSIIPILLFGGIFSIVLTLISFYLHRHKKTNALLP